MTFLYCALCILKFIIMKSFKDKRTSNSINEELREKFSFIQSAHCFICENNLHFDVINI